MFETTPQRVFLVGCVLTARASIEFLACCFDRAVGRSVTHRAWCVADSRIMCQAVRSSSHWGNRARSCAALHASVHNTHILTCHFDLEVVIC